jgi:hypothetical protein
MARLQPGSLRELAELILGYGLILAVLWTPESAQRILSPIAFAVTLAIVLADGQTREELGFGLRGLVPSLWILPAAAALTVACVLLSKRAGTLHSLYDANFGHVAGYFLWTLYQQFLLQDYFLPRMTRVVANERKAVLFVAVLFATAHLPNLVLTAATFVWGLISCMLFRRYHNLYAIGLAQGLLGLCCAVCVPDALNHHMRVGLGYLHYHATRPAP